MQAGTLIYFNSETCERLLLTLSNEAGTPSDIQFVELRISWRFRVNCSQLSSDKFVFANEQLNDNNTEYPISYASRESKYTVISVLVATLQIWPVFVGP